MKKVALFGISNPVAVEALRVLSIHPLLELAVVADETFAGQRVAHVLPGFNVSNRLPVSEVEDALEGEFEVAIVAEAPNYAAPILAELKAQNRRFVDLSGSDAAQSYGMSFRHEAIISAAQSVRVPSPTAQALNTLLVPIASQGLLRGCVQAVATGGAFGVNPIAGERSPLELVSIEVLKTPVALESSQFLSGAEGEFPFELQIVTQTAPSGRALLLTAFVELSERLTLSTLDNLYRQYYEPALFITQMTAPLEAASVVASNRAHFFLRASGNQLCGTLVLDVLGRGSALQAIECVNLMLGLPEEAGLLFPGHG